MKRFQLLRDTSKNYNGLAYLYEYTGEIHINKNNIQKKGKSPFRLAIIQNLYPTHFIDKYEMARKYPNLVRYM